LSFTVFTVSALKRRVLIILLVISQQLYADADGPDFWLVRGVEKSDVLYMRQHADFRAPRTGEISHDAQCIKNLGCKGGLTYHEFTTLPEAEKQRIMKQRPRWCRVSYRGQTGWVAGRYLQEGACVAAAAEDTMARAQGVDPYNHRYRVNNHTVVLHHGRARTKIEGTTAVRLTEIGRNPLFVDVNGDGLKDAVTLLIQQSGGSGTFYYLAVALADVQVDASVGTVIESYFLGDRIKVVSINLVSGDIVVDYLDRAKDQSMSGMPEVRITKKFRLDGDKLVVHP
jgi:hypothetical protein